MSIPTSEDASKDAAMESETMSIPTSEDTSKDAAMESETMAIPVSEDASKEDAVSEERMDSSSDTKSATQTMGEEGGLVTDPSTLQSVLDLAEEWKSQTVFEYADFTAEEFLAEVASVYQTAHSEGFVYGDSKTMPPCEDGFISCDRMIARALWNLGLTDQPDSGMNVGKEVQYLTTHGFELVTDQSKLVSGDIVMQDNGVSGIPNWRWHTFVLVSYDPETTMCEKYDCGHFTPEGEDRISSEQPFYCPLADFGTERRFVCGFHLREKPQE
jgi:hypothetical protein